MPSRKKNNPAGDYIVIVGADTFNKGAEAMLFVVIDEMKKRFPTKDFYLFSAYEFDGRKHKNSNLDFKVLPWELATKIKTLNAWGRLLIRDGIRGDAEARIRTVLKKTLCILDISGYQLSSETGDKAALDYLFGIMVAKRYSVPYFILPQSVGPFEFKTQYNWFLSPMMKLYLRYPLKIYIRERAGIKYLKNYRQNDIRHSFDIVLQKEKYNLKHIYKEVPKLHKKKLKNNAVGIIPSMQIFKRLNSEKTYLIYQEIIENLFDKNKHVYLMKHSAEDLKYCERLFEKFKDTKRIDILSDEFNSIELENIIKQYDFIITSRYHSIINGYKNGVPAIVLGWAVKYVELLEKFFQIDYLIDYRSNDLKNDLKYAVKKMLNNYDQEVEKIYYHFSKLKKDKIFDEISQTLNLNKRN